VSPEQKRRVYIIMAALIVALFAVGVVSGYMGRHKALCKDGKPPVRQRDTGLNQVIYQCHNGQVITK
jgi:hypothetical protein